MGLAVASLATAAVGTGVAVYNANQQAKTARAVGNYNASLTDVTSEYNAQQVEAETAYNAAQAVQIAEYNAKRAEETSDYNARATMAAADYNYLLAENQAQLADMTGRENIRRMRVEGRKTMNTQQARYAKAGVVVETGTPLEVMAETAGLIELNVLDEKRKADAEAQATRTQGAMQRYLAFKDAEATRYFGAQEAWQARYQGAQGAWATRNFGAQKAYATRYFGAQEATGQRLYGASASQGYKAQAVGTLLSGASQMAGAAAGYKAQGVF
jgi:hypothetical protein